MAEKDDAKITESLKKTKDLASQICGDLQHPNERGHIESSTENAAEIAEIAGDLISRTTKEAWEPALGRIATTWKKRADSQEPKISREEVIDTATASILETVGGAGFHVIIESASVTAINKQTNERFIVRFDNDHFYDAVVELAQQVGIDLEDG